MHRDIDNRHKTRDTLIHKDEIKNPRRGLFVKQ